MTKKKFAKFELNLEELEVLLYILMDWRRLKSDLVEFVEYPNGSASATKFVRMFRDVWESLYKKNTPLDKDK
jgi:hypothetical protein